jgi:hypothetical protein
MANFAKRFNLIIILVALVFSCNSRAKYAYLFYYKEYYSCFKDKYNIYRYVRKKLLRNFYNLKEIRIKSFASLTSEINKLKKIKSECVVFLDDFNSTLMLKNNQFPDDSNIKLITYNIEELQSDNNFPVFNIKVNNGTIVEKIINLLEKYSKQKDLSDCGIIISTKYNIGFDIMEKITPYNIEMLKLDESNDAKSGEILIKNYLASKNKKIVVFCGFEFNNYIYKIQEDILYNDLIIIEIITNYGQTVKNVKYRLDIDWQKAILLGINSKKFRDFLGSKKQKNDINSNKNMNYIYNIENDCLIIEKNENFIINFDKK